MFNFEGGGRMEKLKMHLHNTPGILITFCGLDGSGKTTMIDRVEKYIAEMGLNVFLTKQPTSFVRKSDIFRTYMDQADHSAFDYRSLSLLAASDRVQHSNRVILPELEKGRFVISDRYFYSCLANLRARGYSEDTWIYDIAQSIPKPDIAFFIDIDVPTAISRVRERPNEKNRFIDELLQEKLRYEYLDIADKNGGIVISSDISEDETFHAIQTKIDQVLVSNYRLDNIVKNIISEISRHEENLDYNNSLKEDLGMDSISHVMLMMELEERFKIQFEESDMDPFALISVGDVVSLMKKYVGDKDEQTTSVC